MRQGKRDNSRIGQGVNSTEPQSLAWLNGVGHKDFPINLESKTDSVQPTHFESKLVQPSRFNIDRAARNLDALDLEVSSKPGVLITK
jgi:hypothetical protein